MAKREKRRVAHSVERDERRAHSVERIGTDKLSAKRYPLNAKESDFIKFLGTAGARFVMIKQLRASGGIWVSYRGTNVLIDPGPGSIVRCAKSLPRLDPSKLDGIILTHRHLDHSNDINIMIEAMTEGGFKKRGVVFLPSDAIAEHPVISNHAINFPQKIELLEEYKRYNIGELEFSASMKHLHSAETYGLKFNMNKTSVSLLSDTRYFDALTEFYKTDILIICVTFYEPHPDIDHLCLSEAREIIRKINPKKAILTHFGMSMLKSKPHIQAQELTKQLGIEVVAAHDGMVVDIT